jgi:class 3 adenylate cyclase
MQKDRRPILSDIIDGGHYSLLLQPVYRDLDEDGASEIVGYFKAELPWKTYFQSLLPDGKKGIMVVVENTCGQTITYVLDGPKATFVGNGDHHDPAFDDMGAEEGFDPLALFDEPGFETSGCEYTIKIYPSQEYRQEFENNKPFLYTAIGVMVILVSAVVFLIYDWFVRKRQDRLVTSAKRSNALVDSLFPANVRDRLLGKDESTKETAAGIAIGRKLLRNPFRSSIEAPKGSADGHDAENPPLIRLTKPIADLFPTATVIFADICGFTAWSSAREPSQVFALLESIYDAFDQIAKKTGVFKVETIGDCYVAVTGLPTPREDHALVMAHFARRCLEKMSKVVRELEILLGPGTGDLGMRFGLHSGPVMAGVLRGEKSRFQLFGDAMNTASRIEQTGAKNRIHISQQTADLLVCGGKGAWVKPRDGLVTAKGKGKLQTFWLEVNSRSDSPHRDERVEQARMNKASSLAIIDLEFHETKQSTRQQKDGKLDGLVSYNTEVLTRLLKKMLAMRGSNKSSTRRSLFEEPKTSISHGTVLDEVKEIITLHSKPAPCNESLDTVDELSSDVSTQLRDYVTTIASMYRSNPFHSFDHASHVTMSVTKLLSRVVTPNTIDYTGMTYKAKAAHSKLHEYTFGITSDPLIPFAIAFSALIHDVDHMGVPNVQLVKEGAEIAENYGNQSVAEQNSVDLAWELLMEPAYQDLRRCIYTTQGEHDRFRQLVVNTVMATDIVDKDLGAFRKRRWENAFNPELLGDGSNEQEKVNRKATIVIEHLIQASDVAHTMQHWHVFCKWNKRLFNEMYLAYLNGRGETDPSLGWYEGEIGFFDFYIIPLAKKLKECGVFGVSSDEYLDYAIANRNEWEHKGRSLVQEYVSEFHENGGSELNSSSNVIGRRISEVSGSSEIS